MFEVIQRPNFARGMPCKAVHGILSVHAEAVIVHLKQLCATTLHHDLDAARLRIQSIFQELLEDRSRALDHFTGRDMANDCLGKCLHPTHALVLLADLPAGADVRHLQLGEQVLHHLVFVRRQIPSGFLTQHHEEIDHVLGLRQVAHILL